jgi:hypothetical protein
MRGRDPLVVHPDRDSLRRLQEAARPIGEFFEVHFIEALFGLLRCSGRAAARNGTWRRRFFTTG